MYMFVSFVITTTFIHQKWRTVHAVKKPDDRWIVFTMLLELSIIVVDIGNFALTLCCYR